MDKSHINYYVMGVVVCMLLVMGCAIIVFTLPDFPARLTAALLGTVLTATITAILFKGQAKKAKEDKRDSKIFEEKLKIYQRFLSTLYNAIKDRNLTEEDKVKLEYQTSLVAIHCNPNNLVKLSETVYETIHNICPSDKTKKKSQEEEPMLRYFLEVVKVFKQDLYNNEEVFSPAIVDNFKNAYKETQINDEDNAAIDDKTDESEKHSFWGSAVKKWQDAGWIVKSMESEDCPLKITRNDVKQGMIDMGFYDNHYYLQARYEGDWNFSKCLKWDNGGRRQRELWWEYPPLSMDVPKGGFIDKFKSSPELQQYIVKKVEYLMDVILKNDQTTRWMKEVGPHDDWTLFTWYWSTLACEYQKDDEGKVYMDTRPSDDNHNVAIIQLGNRANNVEMLKKTLARIGCADKIKDIDEKDCYVNLDTTTSIEPKVVGERLNYWIGKISEKNKSNI